MVTPKTSVKLNDLMFQALDHGINSIKGGGQLIPFVMSEPGKKMTRFVAETLEIGLEKAREFVSKQNLKIKLYAVAYDGFVTIDGIKYDAVTVEAGEHGSKESILICQRYKPKKFLKKFEVIGNPAVIGSTKNILK